MSAGVGGWDWASRTGGRLRRRDELDQLLRVARSRVGPRMRHLAANLGPRVRAGRGVPVEWRVAQSPPDSAFARAAFAAAREASSDILLGHCLRTWLWADLLAQADRVHHDPEVLYTACILHDLGLTAANWCSRTECFAVEGGLAAHDLATTHGYPHARTLAEAIMLHLNVEVPLALGAEAHLLRAAAAMDLLGQRARMLPAHVVLEVLARHPRDGFAAEIDQLSARQAAVRPRSRIALLRRLGLANLTQRGEAIFTRLHPPPAA